jgi:hypothetical protein
MAAVLWVLKGWTGLLLAMSRSTIGEIVKFGVMINVEQ